MLLLLGITAVFAVILTVWADWLKRKSPNPSSLKLLPSLPGMVWALSGIVAMIGVWQAHAAVANVPASEKATRLAGWISFSMYSALLGGGLLVIMLGIWIWLTVRIVRQGKASD